MKSDAVSFTRFFVILIIAFIVAVYQFHVFKTEVYMPVFGNSSENF